MIKNNGRSLFEEALGLRGSSGYQETERETDESARPKGDCFYCFKVSGYPDEVLALLFDILLEIF